MTKRGGVGIVALIVGVPVLAFVLLVLVLNEGGCPMSGRSDDMNSLRQLAALLLERLQDGKLPMMDGALDVYVLVRNGDLRGANLKLLRSNRSGTGPTDEEIARGDYTHFPWERYRGDGKLEGPPFPVLWEKKPDENGRCLVALSDGSARYCDREEAEAILRPR